MAQPESKYKQMNKEARKKERLDQQKMLVSLPGGKTLEDYLGAEMKCGASRGGGRPPADD
jgi:hypothetical protein